MSQSQEQKVKLVFSYDGSDYYGWQKQPDQSSVQETLETTLEQLLQHKVSLMASGRTDAGVHAKQQVAHFTTSKDLNNYQLIRALNGMTPNSISVHGAWLAPEEFHSVASCEQKTYEYLVLNREVPSAFRARYSHHETRPLNLDALNQMAAALVGEKDFKSFQTLGTPVKSTIREIYQASWEPETGGYLKFTITGNGFLKQMVRNIVGTQLDLHHKHKGDAPQAAHEIEEILAAKDRTSALGTAPPQGLFLTQVVYPGSLDKKCRKL